MMYSIKQFLSEFGNILFDEHLELILEFERKYRTLENYNNDTSCSQMCSRDGDVTDSCSCFKFKTEKEKIISLIERYYKLSKYFTTTTQNVGINVRQEETTRDDIVKYYDDDLDER